VGRRFTKAAGAMMVVAGGGSALSLGAVATPPAERTFCGDGGTEFWIGTEIWRPDVA